MRRTDEPELFEGDFWSDPYPAYADRDSFGAWSTTMVDDSPADAKEAASAQLAGYLGALVARSRAEPDDALLSSLIAIADGGDRLSAEELVAMAMMLLIAGHETTTNLIGNGVLALITRPEQRELLGRRPERMPVAVEIGRLLAAYPRLRLAVDPTELVHRRSTLVRGLTALPVLLT